MNTTCGRQHEKDEELLAHLGKNVNATAEYTQAEISGKEFEGRNQWSNSKTVSNAQTLGVVDADTPACMHARIQTHLI